MQWRVMRRKKYVMKPKFPFVEEHYILQKLPYQNIKKPAQFERGLKYIDISQKKGMIKYNKLKDTSTLKYLQNNKNSGLDCHI